MCFVVATGHSTNLDPLVALREDWHNGRTDNSAFAGLSIFDAIDWQKDLLILGRRFGPDVPPRTAPEQSAVWASHNSFVGVSAPSDHQVSADLADLGVFEG